MLDIRYIRDNPDSVQKRLGARGGAIQLKIDELIACDEQRRAAETRLQQLQADRKRMSKEIGIKRGKGEDTSAAEAQVRGMGDDIAKLVEQAHALEKKQRELLLIIPNVPHANAPIGS